MKRRGLSADNVVFGMGGELLQQVNRDTQKFAMKASAIRIHGEWRDVYKDPITDKGKRSKKGRLALTRIGGQWQTVPRDTIAPMDNELVTVFKNGKAVTEYTLDQVRDKALGRTQRDVA